ncbi:MAG TPA: DoxX-like family protein [Bryobacteraceae bacterium]|jgi:uncharacterized membrane protein YphA (DoxX/SURF4 family)|nr:DoxX-like family protein [Bryobacteraceae bacterium]
MMCNLLLPRMAIALVWIYQGFWCKLLGRAPHHQKIVGATPFFNSARARQALVVLGCVECVLAVWVLSGVGAHEAALMQTLLLVSMNAAGLLWARSLIPDPAAMLLQNFVFLLLAWTAAGFYAGV